MPARSRQSPIGNSDALTGAFEEAQNTSEYQFDSAIVELTEAICEIMAAQGVSRADLARRMGKSRAWVTKLLRGDRNLTIKTVVDVLWELGYKANVHTEPRDAPAAPASTPSLRRMRKVPRTVTSSVSRPRSRVL